MCVRILTGGATLRPSLYLHCLWYLVSCTLFAKDLNWAPKGLKVSRLLIADMILFVTISNFLKCQNILSMTFNIAHWDTSDNSFAF
jgi:hypothetical protein